MDLEEFRAFIAVAETGSFLAAANNLNVARATLRRRVEALEARAGVPLLERSARGVVLTEAGSVLAVKGRSVLQEASALVASVREIGREPVGVLRVLLPVGLPPHALAGVLAGMRATYPRLMLQVRFCEVPGDEALADTDLVVHFGGVGPLPGSWLSYEVMKTREWLIASTDYLQRRGTPTKVADLAGHELLSWCAPGEDGRVWPTRSGEPLEVDPMLVCADVHLIRQCVIAGLGIGYVPDAMLPDPGVPYGAIVPVLSEEVGRERSLHLAVPTALAHSPKLRAVVKQIQEFEARFRGGP